MCRVLWTLIIEYYRSFSSKHLHTNNLPDKCIRYLSTTISSDFHLRWITPTCPIPLQGTHEILHLSFRFLKEILLCWAENLGLWKLGQMRKYWKSCDSGSVKETKSIKKTTKNTPTENNKEY